MLGRVLRKLKLIASLEHSQFCFTKITIAFGTWKDMGMIHVVLELTSQLDEDIIFPSIFKKYMNDEKKQN